MNQAGEQERLRRDVLWNAASLVVLATSGILLQVLIGRRYGAAALGSFNQVLAAYIVFSQVATAGIHQSVLRFVSEHASSRERLVQVVGGAMLPLVAVASALTLAFLACAEPLAALLGSDMVAVGVRAATPALFFFALNKVLIAVVNGERRMRAFAVYQALRYALILAGLLVCMALDFEAAALPFVFTFAEGLLFVVLALEVTLRVAWWRGVLVRGWGGVHLRYGLKGIASGMMLELNSRVDVLMLGLYLSDEHVGVYSCAALFAEGFYQLVVVLQNNYNPLMAQDLARGRPQDLRELVGRGRRWFVPALAAGGLLGILLYPWTISLFFADDTFAASYLPFAILVSGIVLSSAHLPFQHALLMGGRPGWHSIYMISVVATNAVLNALLIPPLGIAGAALGSALAFLAAALYLRELSLRLLCLRL